MEQKFQNVGETKTAEKINGLMGLKPISGAHTVKAIRKKRKEDAQ